MESFVRDNTPLAEYLECEGTNDSAQYPASDIDTSATPPKSFAPSGHLTLQSRLRSKLRDPLRNLVLKQDQITQIRKTCLRVVKGGTSSTENIKFLEHFRYILVASQLLEERRDRAPLRTTRLIDKDDDDAITSVPTFSAAGAAASTLAAVAFAWTIQLGRTRAHDLLGRGGPVVLAVMWTAIAVFLYICIRRRMIYSVRHQAVNAVTRLISNTQAFEASTSAALTFIQEVEVVSRGYKVSSPLPPVSRLEEMDTHRRCTKLRRTLCNGFESVIPTYLEACNHLRPLIDEAVFEQYSILYDIGASDLERGSVGYSDHELEDLDTLKSLRAMQQHVSNLRRIMLGELLSLPAEGEKADFTRWRRAVDEMDHVNSMITDFTQKLGEVVSEEERFNSPTTPKVPTTPGRDKIRAQIRNLNSLSQGIRGLQAKMQVIREESNKAMEESGDISDLGQHLMTQYESLGSDLLALVHAWENGKASLAVNIDKAERRISLASSGFRSPAPSLGGLTEVDEGSPSETLQGLQGLNGELPLSRSVSSASATSSDEEVFEAVAVPQQRSTLTRAERITKMHEDRARQELLKEKRDASTTMLKELESVISLRPLGLKGHTRVTSL